MALSESIFSYFPKKNKKPGPSNKEGVADT